MAVRLNKALKELNVGINTVAEFLQKKGLALQDATPNAKITDEQYALLQKEFGEDMKQNAETKQKIQNQKVKEQQEKKERQQAAREEKERLEKERLEKEKAAKKPQLKIVGNINDLKKEEPKPKQEVKTEVEPKSADPAPKEETPVVETEKKEVEPAPAAPVEQAETPATEEAVQKETTAKKKGKQTPADRLEQDENGVYHLAAPAEAGVQFKQVGFIDLSSLNSKTRPDRKSKAERRKERQQAQGDAQGQNGQNAQKKRNRIKSNKVDIDAAAKQNNGQNQQGQGKKQGGKQGQNNNQQQKAQQQAQQQGQGKKKNKKKQPPKPQELTEEEVAKQVKETLARLTAKQEKKGVKYRKDKRQAIHERMAEEEMAESAESKVLKITEFVTANELATMMDISVNQVIATCMSIGMMVSINQRLDAETINIVAEEFGFTTQYVSGEVSNAIEEVEDKEEDLERRAPIITVMGHVDHGKTSLLDYIRNTNVIAGEAGGITQHIGAYKVKLKDGRKITFLDTPGHEAFTAMRARGAQVTDIAIIIIAADDDVMPQTKEAIAHAQAAGVPMVFAINKIDKPGANPDKIKEQLSAMNLLVEEWGGKYQSQDISAKKGIGVEDLMDKVLLEAEWQPCSCRMVRSIRATSCWLVHTTAVSRPCSTNVVSASRKLCLPNQP